MKDTPKNKISAPKNLSSYIQVLFTKRQQSAFRLVLSRVLVTPRKVCIYYTELSSIFFLFLWFTPRFGNFFL